MNNVIVTFAGATIFTNHLTGDSYFSLFIGFLIGVWYFIDELEK
jgi:hypothetical protein